MPRAAEDERWGYEFKWDGVRALGHVRAGQLTLVSRNDRDVKSQLPRGRRAGQRSEAPTWFSMANSSLSTTPLVDPVSAHCSSGCTLLPAPRWRASSSGFR
ncbi:MAG: hypothetical protein WKG07_08760 [Hymenobacter sp.]